MIVMQPISFGASEVLSNNTGNNWYDALVNTVESETFALSLSIQPGSSFDTLVLLNLNSPEVTVEVLDDDGGTQRYLATYSLDNSFIDNWYSYFFADFDYAKELVVSMLPPYEAGVINITIQPASTAQVGMVLLGKGITLGETDQRIRFGIRDYSVKDVNDSTGDVTITEGNFTRRLEGESLIDQRSVNYANTIMSELRATPAVWIPTTDTDFSSMLTYGYPRDWRVTPDDGSLARLSFSIEGLI